MIYEDQLCSQGYFQLLFSCIEKLLAFLNVQNLVLPAAEEAESIWTEKFGFQKIKPDQVWVWVYMHNKICLFIIIYLIEINVYLALQLSRYRKSCCHMVRFEGTSMLQKAVPTCRIVNQSIESFGYCKQEQ